jgi:hypothetical protein
VSEADDIALGRAAWERIREHARRSWGDWLAVGRALQIGRALALEAAGIDVPYGKRYTEAMGRWLAENGLDAIGQQVRHRVLSCMDNLPEIEAWRASLPEAERGKYNHPDSNFWRWKNHARPEPMMGRRLRMPPVPKDRPAMEPEAKPCRSNRPIFWTQDHIRRAHRAMLDSRSSDLLTLARCALEGAIRDENDLHSLLEERPSRRAPASAAAHLAV